jgi:uncharacterized protein (UPF0332 family)
MPHAENKVNWCIKKAEKELRETGRHRGLILIRPDKDLALAHIKKAEHTITAIADFQRIGYSDGSASAAFYTIYHCLLALAAKHGYESRNQECTFALIYQLIEMKKIKINKKHIEEISSLNPESTQENPTIMDIREIQQYGVATSLENRTLEKILETAKTILDQTKEEIDA